MELIKGKKKYFMEVKIFGYGEIGKSLAEVYRLNGIDVAWKDLNDSYGEDECDLLNVCIPYNENFTNSVMNEIKISNPKYVVIHSTVSPGTTANIANFVNAVVCHSPVIGVHPNLRNSLMTFTKWFGGGNDTIFEHFVSINIKAKYLGPPEATEIMKLWDTTYYGMCLAINAEVQTMLEKYEIPYNGWVEYLKAYNAGYELMGKLNVQRPYFDELNMPIGGHCVVPNTKILTKYIEGKEVINLINKYS